MVCNCLMSCCGLLLADYETWELRVDVMFNVSASVSGWIELRIVQLGLLHHQRISLDVNSSNVHIVTTAKQVPLQYSALQYILV